MVGRPLLLATALLVVALPALAGPAPRGEETRARDAVKLWLDASRQGLTPLALLALADLAAHDHPVAADALLELLEHEPPVFHPTARRVLGGFARVETLDYVARRGLEHRSPRVRSQVLLSLADGRPQAYDWQQATRLALNDPAPEVRAAAVRSLGRARSLGDLPTLVELLSDDSTRVRQVLPEAVTRLAPVRALPFLDELIDDPQWRVRLAVIRALTSLRSLPATERLVDRLETEPGRLREDILLALQELTGRNFGLSLPAWRRFLETSGQAALATRNDPGRGVELPSLVKYYGVGTLSSRFVLITDLSGSMGTPASTRYGSADGGGSRLAHTQRQLHQLIEDLDDTIAFNLITFTDGVQPWRARLLDASPKNKQRALSEIDGWTAEGGTNIQGALDTVFDLAQDELDGRSDTGPDTVFLLSDGEPSAGMLRDTRLLLKMAAERNRDLHLRIHCISLTSSTTSREFLHRLASATGGRFVNPLE